MELELALVGIIGLTVCVALLWRLAAGIAALERQLAEAEARGKALMDRIQALDNIAERQRQVEDTLHTGGSIVREVHRGIADLPFGILESIPGVAQPTKIVRQLHDKITDGVYETLAGINKAVGRELRRGLQPSTDEGPKEKALGTGPDEGRKQS